MYTLVALSIHEPRPDSISRLLPESSHENTSSVIPSAYNCAPYLSAARVSGELSVMVLPSGESSVPPNEYSTDRQLWLPSLVLANAWPQGCPAAFSLRLESSRVT